MTRCTVSQEVSELLTNTVQEQWNRLMGVPAKRNGLAPVTGTQLMAAPSSSTQALKPVPISGSDATMQDASAPATKLAAGLPHPGLTGLISHIKVTQPKANKLGARVVRVTKGDGVAKLSE